MRRRPRRAALPRLRAMIEATSPPTGDVPRPVSGPGRVAFVRAPGRLAAGQRVYAIADIHGFADKLAALHAVIAEDLARRPAAQPRLLHLGDYVGAGPDSAGVIERLLAGSPGGMRAAHLAGDHEQMLLDALDGDRAAGTDWLQAGGGAALRSWGTDPAAPREEWAALIPAAHQHFLRRLALQHREGDYLFVHAGVRPGVPLALQSRDDLQRIRQPFLYTEQDFGAVVVHGHTATPVPVVAANRIGVDTGVAIGGALTCVVLEDDGVGFLAA